MDVFKLFFKSRGGEPTLPISTDYHYPVAKIEANNFETLGKEATDKIQELGMNMGEFSIDVINHGQDYTNANGSGRKSQKDIFTNHTGEY